MAVAYRSMMFMGHYLAIPPYAAADLVFIYIIT